MTEGWESSTKSPKTYERWKDLSSVFPIPDIIFLEGVIDRRLRSRKSLFLWIVEKISAQKAAFNYWICIDNTLTFYFTKSLRKAAYICLPSCNFSHFHKLIKNKALLWVEGRIPALVKSRDGDLFKDNVPILIKEKMFYFCFSFAHLSTIQISVNSTFSIMILTLQLLCSFSSF